MTTEQRPIFRAEAVRRYMHSQQATVLPRLVRPLTFRCLWILLGLLLLGGSLMTWYARKSLFTAEEISQSTVFSWRNKSSGLRSLDTQALVECG